MKIPELGHEFANIRINLSGDNIKVKADNIELKPVLNFPFTKYEVFAIENFPVKNLEIYGDEAIISIGDKYYFIEKPNGNLNLKYRSNTKYINDKGTLKSFQIRFLSMFYNSIVFMYLVFGLFLFFIFKKTRHYMIFYILALSLILRLGDLSQGLWTDEFYTVYIAGNYKLPFISTFNDPGNPPLFYILIRLSEKIFKYNFAYLRILPVLFSCGSVYLTYYVIKKYSNIQSALLFSFLLSISAYSVVSAQELRCYSALYFFSLCLTIYLFKIIENPDKKNFIIYAIFGSILANLHYFGCLILFFNFIYGIIFIKKRACFILANVVSVTSFLPYFFKTSYYQALVNTAFNNDIEKIDYIKTFIRFSQGILSSIILTALGILAIIKRNKFFSYNFLLICFLFIFCFLVGFIRPIAREYYFIAVLPNFLILASYMFNFNKLKYYIPVVFLFSCFTFKDFVDRQRDLKTDFESLIQYCINDKTTGSKAIIVGSFKKDIEASNYISKDISIEMTSSKTSNNELLDIIEKSKSKNIYLRIPSEYAYNFLANASKKYKADFIRIKHDLIIVKIEK